MNTSQSMNMTRLSALMVSTLCGALLMTQSAAASVEGINASEITVTVEARRGGEWFDSKEYKTDRSGVIENKNIPDGTYRIKIHEDDVQENQAIAFKTRVLDEEFRPIDEPTTVNLYVHIGDTKILAGTQESDDEGWIEAAGFTNGMEFSLDVDGDGEYKKKEGKPRMKVYAKIDDSDWFLADLQRIENGVLELDHVLPGKYKMKAKSKDRSDIVAQQPFTVKATLYDEDGDRINEKTKVKIYGYFFGVKTKIAEIYTDKKGRIEVPGAMAGMKIRLKY